MSKVYGFCNAGCKYEVVSKADVPFKEVHISKAEYEALNYKEPNTIYFVYDEEEVSERAIADEDGNNIKNQFYNVTTNVDFIMNNIYVDRVKKHKCPVDYTGALSEVPLYHPKGMNINDIKAYVESTNKEVEVYNYEPDTGLTYMRCTNLTPDTHVFIYVSYKATLKAQYEFENR